MPLPARVSLADGKFEIDGNLEIQWDRPANILLTNAELYFLGRLGEKRGHSLAATSPRSLHVNWKKNVEYPPTFAGEEAYQIHITPQKAALSAQTEIGVLRGLETLLQLAVVDESGLYFPTCTIEDQPRYDWRGLMIDVSRHWMPKEVILRTLKGMAVVKMNVLHLHLTDDQGFRVESKKFPKLHEQGADGKYYSQEEIFEIVTEATKLGIRVIPEFDVPGHTTSWLVGHPELGSAPGSYELPTTFGIKPAALDPTKESTYAFLDTLFGEMAALFLDPYFHIGGDEVNPEAWENNEEIQQFIQENELGDEHGLQAYFNRRMADILQKHGKRMMGWDEVLHLDLPKETLVHAWRNHKALFEAAVAGHPTILSNGWYLDHKLPARTHYAVNPDVVKGGVNIEPDSIWTSYGLEMEVQGNVIPSTLTLFGEGESLRGVWSVMGNMAGFETAELQGSDLAFEVEGPIGTVSFEGKLEGDQIQGDLSVAMLGFEVAGEKIGAHDLPGTTPPKIEKVPTLTEESRTKIIGGEACMWSEVVSLETIDSRIWPRTAAIAEKLWSPQVLTEDVPDMYRRLDIMSEELDQLGLNHQRYRGPMLKRIAPNSPDLAALETLVDVLEESKYYERLGEMFGKPLDTPLEFLADAAAPESQLARHFSQEVEAFLADSTHTANQKSILRNLRMWEANHRPFLSTIHQNPDLKPYEQLSKFLSVISNIGTKAVHAVANGTSLPEEEGDYYQDMLTIADESVLGVELAVVEPIRRLIEAAK